MAQWKRGGRRDIRFVRKNPRLDGQSRATAVFSWSGQTNIIIIIMLHHIELYVVTKYLGIYTSLLNSDLCCQVDCSNGQVGYGRRRRRRDVFSAGDPNKVYEVSMATVVKVAEQHVEGTPELWVEKGIVLVGTPCLINHGRPPNVMLVVLLYNFLFYSRLQPPSARSRGTRRRPPSPRCPTSSAPTSTWSSTTTAAAVAAPSPRPPSFSPSSPCCWWPTTTDGGDADKGIGNIISETYKAFKQPVK